MENGEKLQEVIEAGRAGCYDREMTLSECYIVTEAT